MFERCGQYQGSRAQIRAGEVSCAWILTLLGHGAARSGWFSHPQAWICAQFNIVSQEIAFDPQLSFDISG